MQGIKGCSDLCVHSSQFWGEKSKISGHFPPELGGLGGKCNVFASYPNSIASTLCQPIETQAYQFI
jgi:hypothetical protein